MTNTVNSFRRDRDAPFDAIHSAPDWQSFIHLVNGWFRQPISADTGVPAHELHRREQASRRPLPAVLREWYRLFGRHESLRDEKVTDSEMPLERVWESPRYVRIYEENQSGWYCGVLDEHRSLPDPPVYLDSRALDPVIDLGYPRDELVDGHFVHVCDRLSDFFLGVVVRQIAFRGEPSPVLRAGVSGAYFPEIRGVGLPLRRIFNLPSGYSPYMGDDIVVVDEWGFAARTPEALARVELAARSSVGLDSVWRVG